MLIGGAGVTGKNNRIDALKDPSDSSTIEAVSSELRGLIKQCTIPSDYVSKIQKSLGAKLSGHYDRKLVMVRSSASVEDMKGISGSLSCGAILQWI